MFAALFLDADRQYSCAYFETDRTPLDEALAAKKRHLVALRPSPSRHSSRPIPPLASLAFRNISGAPQACCGRAHDLPDVHRSGI
jgi:hypothetical protein